MKSLCPLCVDSWSVWSVRQCVCVFAIHNTICSLLLMLSFSCHLHELTELAARRIQKGSQTRKSSSLPGLRK